MDQINSVFWCSPHPANKSSSFSVKPYKILITKRSLLDLTAILDCSSCFHTKACIELLPSSKEVSSKTPFAEFKLILEILCTILYRQKEVSK